MGARLAVVMVCDVCTAELVTNESIYAMAVHQALQEGWLDVDGDWWCTDCVQAEDRSPITMCRICGCTEDRACTTPAGPCHWSEPDLCSGCAADPIHAGHRDSSPAT